MAKDMTPEPRLPCHACGVEHGSMGAEWNCMHDTLTLIRQELGKGLEELKVKGVSLSNEGLLVELLKPRKTKWTPTPVLGKDGAK